jgi:hypothetical protein
MYKQYSLFTSSSQTHRRAPPPIHLSRAIQEYAARRPEVLLYLPPEVSTGWYST